MLLHNILADLLVFSLSFGFNLIIFLFSSSILFTLLVEEKSEVSWGKGKDVRWAFLITILFVPKLFCITGLVN